MKNRISVFLFIIFGFGLFAQDQLPIYKNCSTISSLEEVELEENIISIPSAFGKSSLTFPELRLDNKELLSVIYCYSLSKDNALSEQNRLSDERYFKLINKYPSLTAGTIEWRTYAQLVSKEFRAEELFHGFLITYKPIQKHEITLKTCEKKNYSIGAHNLKEQVFTIDAKKSNIIEGESGTRVFIPKNVFVRDDGSIYNGQVNFEIKEAVKLKDIVAANLITKTASGDLLRSKGMVNISATDNKGNALKIDEGKSILVDINTEFDPEFSHFVGIEDTEGKILWENPNSFDPVSFLNSFPQRIPSKKLDTLGTFRVHKNGFAVITHIFLPLGHKTVKLSRKRLSFGYGRSKGLSSMEYLMVKRWFAQNEVDLKDLEKIKYERGKHLVIYFGLRANTRLTKENEQKSITNIFPMSDMGWANIDCMYRFPNTEPMILEINNSTVGVEEVVISMVIPSINCVLNGFKKENGNYSFTHGEYENKVPYPPGEQAYIVATGIKLGEEYSVIHELFFGENKVEKIRFEKRNKEATERLIDEVF